MRGLYSATFLSALSDRFAESNCFEIGKGFDIVVGTSTGAILAAAIVAGIPLDRIIELYEKAGPHIFKDPIPPYSKSLKWRDRIRFYVWLFRHRNRPANFNTELKSELRVIFGDLTLNGLYQKHRIGLCITATAFLQHKPRIFKTPHLEEKQRDNEITVADACLASSAAPIYLPLASIRADRIDQTYVDGGLWANNPVLLGIIEGLVLSKPKQPIVVLSIGTCPPLSGSPPAIELNRGIIGWRGGVLPLELAMNAQSKATQFAANLLADQLVRLEKQVHILRCEESVPSAEQAHLLQIDATSKESLDLMRQLGNEDAQSTYRWCQSPGDSRGELLTQIFERCKKKSAY